jgi:hypothetical protein
MDEVAAKIDAPVIRIFAGNQAETKEQAVKKLQMDDLKISAGAWIMENSMVW